MRALSLYQPWATLVAIGAKAYETRSWQTSYRGPVAVHASQFLEYLALCYRDEFAEPLMKAGYCGEGFGLSKGEGHALWIDKSSRERHVLPDRLPRGAVVAVADLVECWRIRNGVMVGCAGESPLPAETEQIFGDWSQGRFAWQFDRVYALPEPLPARGKQGIWTIDMEDPRAA